MAFSGGTDTLVLANGYDLSTYLRNTAMNATAGAYDTSTYGVGSKTYIPGLKDGKMTFDGIFDGSAAAVDAVLAAALGVAGFVCTRFPQGDTFGNAGAGLSGHEVSYNVQSPVDGVVSVAGELQSSVSIERVLSLHALAAYAEGTTNGSSINNGADTANGGVGYLEVTAQAGTSAVIKIQHSDDNGVWVDLITFTTVTAAPAKERKAVTGSVEQYVRATCASTGGTITAQVSFGRK